MKPVFKLSVLLLLLNLAAINKAFSQAPTINPIQGDVVICTPVAASIDYSVSASNTPTSYAWSYVGPNNNLILSNTSSSICSLNFSFAYENATYTLYCYAENSSGTSSTASFVVNVFETPTVTFSGASYFCQGSGTAISASSTMFQASSTTISYNWIPSTGLSSNNTPNVIANPLTSTNYTVLLFNGPCTNTNYFNVTVNPLPTLSANLTPTRICQGASASLILSGSSNLFYVNGVQTNPFSSMTPASSTLYMINGTDINGCNSPPHFVTLTVDSVPIVIPWLLEDSICAGETSTLTLNGTATSYSVNSFLSGNDTILLSPLVNTVYIVSGSHPNGCIATSQQFSLTVNPLPVVSSTASPSTICKGENISINSSGAVSYSFNASPEASVFVITPMFSASYTITGESNLGCTNSIVKSFVVDACTGINEYNGNESSLEVFPNPSNGVFTIKSAKNETAYLINELGQTIKILSLANGSATEVSGLNAGIYFIITSDSRKKIVVTK